MAGGSFEIEIEIYDPALKGVSLLSKFRDWLPFIVSG
jgi:hypothetical protein